MDALGRLILVVLLCLSFPIPAPARTQATAPEAAFTRLCGTPEVTEEWFAPQFLAAAPLPVIRQLFAVFQPSHPFRPPRQISDGSRLTSHSIPISVEAVRIRWQHLEVAKGDVAAVEVRRRRRDADGRIRGIAPRTRRRHGRSRRPGPDGQCEEEEEEDP